MLKVICLLLAGRGEQGPVLRGQLGRQVGQVGEGDWPAPWDDPAWPLGREGRGRSVRSMEHAKGREQPAWAPRLQGRSRAMCASYGFK